MKAGTASGVPSSPLTRQCTITPLRLFPTILFSLMHCFNLRLPTLLRPLSTPTMAPTSPPNVADGADGPSRRYACGQQGSGFRQRVQRALHGVPQAPRSLRHPNEGAKVPAGLTDQITWPYQPHTQWSLDALTPASAYPGTMASNCGDRRHQLGLASTSTLQPLHTSPPHYHSTVSLDLPPALYPTASVRAHHKFDAWSHNSMPRLRPPVLATANRTVAQSLGSKRMPSRLAGEMTAEWVPRAKRLCDAP